MPLFNPPTPFPSLERLHIDPQNDTVSIGTRLPMGWEAQALPDGGVRYRLFVVLPDGQERNIASSDYAT